MKQTRRSFNKKAAADHNSGKDAALYGELRFCLNHAAGRGFGKLMKRVAAFREETSSAPSPHLDAVYAVLDGAEPPEIRDRLKDMLDTTKNEPLDIRFKGPRPTWGLNFLSNFAENHFDFRGIECHSMEGLLQSLKFKDAFLQKCACLRAGKDAKQFGADQDWQSEQKLYWQGKAMDRHGKPYQAFLDEAFDRLFYFSGYARRALLETGNHPLTHSTGGKDPRQTVLTEEEFCTRLTRIRSRLQKELAARLNKKHAR